MKTLMDELDTFDKNTKTLIQRLDERLITHENKPLLNYLKHVKKRHGEFSYLVDDLRNIEKIDSFSQKYIIKITSLFIKRLKLDIDYFDDMSTEVAMNKLNSSIGSIAEVLAITINNSKI